MWPTEALDFLRDLESNNDRAWFKANRARYDAYLVQPARELADGLAHLGELRLFRPYNDARFHTRPPMKEQLGMAIGYGPAGGYYVELSLDGLLVGAGLHHPSSDQVARFRESIDDDRRAQGFEEAVRTSAHGGLRMVDPVLKRAPRGYAQDHPRVEHLRRKQVTVYVRHPLEPWLHTPQCAARVRGELEAASPLVGWLAEHVGPPSASAPPGR